MTTNWIFQYISVGGNEQNTKYIQLYDCFRKLKTDPANITYYSGANAGKISYPHFKFNFYNMSSGNLAQYFPLESQTGYWHRGVANTRKPTIGNLNDTSGGQVEERYLSFAFQVFDNLGDITYTSQANNGKVDISFETFSDLIKFDVIECDALSFNVQNELGLVGSGILNIVNAQNPVKENYEMGENDNNNLSISSPRFRQWNLNR